MIKLKRPLIETTTRLCDIPEAWLKIIEPKIMRGPYLPCWVWTGAMNDDGDALILIPGKQIKGHRFVAMMFWELPQTFYVGHTCMRPNCLYPGHLIPQLTKHRMFGKNRLESTAGKARV